MLLLESTKSLDFSSASTNFSPLFVGLAFFGAVAFIGIVAAIIEYDGLYALGGILIGLFMGLFVTMIGMAVTPGERDGSPDRTAALQSWVSDTYLIDLTDRQASDIIDNQINVKDSAEENTDNVTVVVKNAYDEIVPVTLVKDGEDYRLIQYGSEIPAASTGNK